MEEDKGTVCVTGGTGFIASWLVKSLLEHGYSVRTTVRSDPAEITGPKTPGLSSRKLLDTGFKFKYSLADTFDDAIQCCKETGYL